MELLFQIALASFSHSSSMSFDIDLPPHIQLKPLRPISHTHLYIICFLKLSLRQRAPYVIFLVVVSFLPHQAPGLGSTNLKAKGVSGAVEARVAGWGLCPGFTWDSCPCLHDHTLTFHIISKVNAAITATEHFLTVILDFTLLSIFLLQVQSGSVAAGF